MNIYTTTPVYLENFDVDEQLIDEHVLNEIDDYYYKLWEDDRF